MIIKKKRQCYICLTSSDSPISDGFKSLYEDLSEDPDVIFIGTHYSLPDRALIERNNTFCLSYRKSIKGFFELFMAFFSIRKIIFDNDVGKVFIYSSLSFNWIINLLVKSRAELYWWLHDPDVHSGEKIMTIIIKKINDYVLLRSRNLSKVIVASEVLKKNLEIKNVDPQKISIIPFPYVSQIVNFPSDEGVIESRFSSSKVNVIFFGRIEVYKGLDWFARALINYGEQLKDKINVIICGKGEIPKSIYDAKVKGFSFSINNIYVPNDQLKNYIQSAKISIFPYRDATGTQAVQTAGALGCINIVTDVGSLAECVIDNNSFIVSRDDPEGFIVSLGIALNSYADKNHISSLYTDNYSPEVFSKNILSLMSE